VLACENLEQLRAGKVTSTRGDLRCIIFGHIVRMAIGTCGTPGIGTVLLQKN
jgi:hypothetical protein